MNLNHVDTCLPCYLQDHHNRDGETLLSAAVDGGTTNSSVLEELLMQFDSHAMPDGFDYEAARNAVEIYFTGFNMDAPFDSTLEVPDLEYEDGDSCYAYFVLYH